MPRNVNECQLLCDEFYSNAPLGALLAFKVANGSGTAVVPMTMFVLLPTGRDAGAVVIGVVFVVATSIIATIPSTVVVSHRATRIVSLDPDFASWYDPGVDGECEVSFLNSFVAATTTDGKPFFWLGPRLLTHAVVCAPVV